MNSIKDEIISNNPSLTIEQVLKLEELQRELDRVYSEIIYNQMLLSQPMIGFYK